MTTPIFASPLNNISTTLAADYTAGSDEIAIAEGYGDTITAELARLGLPSISSDAPLRFTVTRAGGVNLTTGQILDATDQTVFEATSLDSDTLSGLTVVEGTTDQDFAIVRHPASRTHRRADSRQSRIPSSTRRISSTRQTSTTRHRTVRRARRLSPPMGRLSRRRPTGW
jgi:hypothetical protein